MKSHKDEANAENDESEPPWIGVVIDILLSLLSRSSNYFRSLVTYIFPHFCSFVDQNALQQILDVRFFLLLYMYIFNVSFLTEKSFCDCCLITLLLL